MKRYKVGIVGCTGMVGQRFATLLENHPWFDVVVIAASARSKGKRYEDAVGARWAMPVEMPKAMRDMIVLDADSDAEKIASMVDFIFPMVPGLGKFLPWLRLSVIGDIFYETTCANETAKAMGFLSYTDPSITADAFGSFVWTMTKVEIGRAHV